MRAAIYLLAAALLLAPGALRAQEQEHPSVAEAARQARQAQEHAPKGVKLYTNDNLPRASGGISVVGAPAAEPAAKFSAKKGPLGPEEKKRAAVEEKGAAYWHNRFAETRGKLAQAESELAALERKMGRLQLQYYADPNKALEQQYTRSDIREQQAKIAAKQEEIDGLHRQLNRLEDELRRAGGDPGWAR
jgi:chromosome segregation ATPase